MRNSFLVHVRFLATSLILVCAFSCTKEEVSPRAYPRVSTVTYAVSGNRLTMTGELHYLPKEVLDHGFIYTQGGFPVIGNTVAKVVSLGKRATTGVFVKEIQGLAAGTYDVSAFARSEEYISYGQTLIVVVK